MSDTQEIQYSHILDFSVEEVVDLGMDFTGDEEENADILDLSDNQLEEELSERAEDQTPPGDAMV